MQTRSVLASYTLVSGLGCSSNTTRRSALEVSLKSISSKQVTFSIYCQDRSIWLLELVLKNAIMKSWNIQTTFAVKEKQLETNDSLKYLVFQHLIGIKDVF